MSTKIFTHGDIDGLASGTIAYLIEDRDSDIIFTHPHGILHDLSEFSELGDKIYVLDIALDEKIWRDVIEKLNEYASKNMVIYVDHHPHPIGFNPDQLKNIEYIHGLNKSTSELIHKRFRDELDIEAGRIALYGAIGDYSDETHYIRKLYSYWDKRMIYFEAGILSQALEASRRMYDFKREIIYNLSKYKLPSQINGLIDRAVYMSKLEEEMRRELKENMIILKNLAYAVNPKGSPTRAARYLIGLSGKNVGVAIEYRGEIGIMSLRARKDSVDLNIILRRLTIKYGGSGGGHSDAAGCRIPSGNINRFLKDLDKAIGRYIRSARYPMHIAP